MKRKDKKKVKKKEEKRKEEKRREEKEEKIDCVRKNTLNFKINFIVKLYDNFKENYSCLYIF